MLHSEIQGRHIPNKGEGLTLQDLLELLQSVPRKARDNYLTVNGQDVIGLAFGQSTQAEKWEFYVNLILDKDGGL